MNQQATTENSEQKKSRARKIIDFVNNNRDLLDLFFMVLRNTRPNLVLPNDAPVLITRFRDVQEALERPDVFNVPYAPMIDPCVGPYMLGRDDTTINERDKGIMKSVIRREDLPSIRNMVAELTQESIKSQLENKQIDVVPTLSRHVPLRLTGEYFGFPGPDIEALARWSRATQSDIFYNPENELEVHQASVDAGAEMKSYLKELIRERRAALRKNPELDDVLSRLLKFNFPPEIGFDEERISANIMGTLVGGIETTNTAIVRILEQLFKRPKALAGAIAAAVADDNALLYQYCWEALRFCAQTPFLPRTCVKDYRIAAGTLRAATIKQGSKVLICTGSAMRDGRELPAASEFCIDRPGYHYMHLGYGSHTCLGDQVSKVQVPEIVKHLLRLPNIRAGSKIDFADNSMPEHYTVLFDTAH
ncbi:MAG: hypothetical protein DHS20C12_29800 [Pseudohongiella sp.]|nr:MAG: hypothetical protein DHS20C12_29800 [Pseudohongiella sp.]